MNLPNKLTILRVIMIPFFVFFLLSGVGGSASKWIALVIFAAASITDTLDGYIARRDNLITDFGKFMDPLADKLLVCSALICFVELDKLPAWMVIIIIAREFIISGFRLGCFGQWNCHRSKLVGKIENNQPDDYDHSSDRRHSGTFRAEYRADLGCTDSDRCFSD